MFSMTRECLGLIALGGCLAGCLPETAYRCEDDDKKCVTSDGRAGKCLASPFGVNPKGDYYCVFAADTCPYPGRWDASASRSLAGACYQPVFFMATGDFDGDNMPDLAVGDSTSTGVTINWGNGAVSNEQVPGSRPTVMVAWNFDNKRQSALVLASPDNRGFGGRVLYYDDYYDQNNQLAGKRFQSRGEVFSGGTYPTAVAVGNFYPGKLGLAVANKDGVTIQSVDGSGPLQGPQSPSETWCPIGKIWQCSQH